MSISSIETSTQPTTAPRNAVQREAVEILGRAELAIDAIEGGVDDLNSAMVELLLLVKYDLPDIPDEPAKAETEAAADALGADANELFAALSSHFRELREWVIAATANVEDEAEEDAS